MPGADGIILLDKPAGLSSFAVVAAARGALSRHLAAGRRLKCGHAGTLDPLATGLLLLLCGRGTRLAPFLLGLDKSYRFTVRFGAGTDTLDSDGRPEARAAVTFAPAAVSAVLPRFCGEIVQVPPIYSALKRGGQPLYRLARAGREVAEPPARPVRVARLELLATRWGMPLTAAELEPALAAADDRIYEADLLVECSSGTYVRALARDLARELDTVGHLRALRRVTVGSFVVGDALAGDALRDGAALVAALRPLAVALPHLPSVTLSDAQARLVRQGQAPELDSLGSASAGTAVALRDPRGALVAVGRVEPAATLRLAAVFPAVEEDTTCA